MEAARDTDAQHAARAEARAVTVEQSVEALTAVSAAARAHADASKNQVDLALELCEAQDALARAAAHAHELSAKDASTSSQQPHTLAGNASELSLGSHDAREASKAVGKAMREVIVSGTALWKNGKRAECCAAYKTAAKDALERLPAVSAAKSRRPTTRVSISNSPFAVFETGSLETECTRGSRESTRMESVLEEPAT